MKGDSRIKLVAWVPLPQAISTCLVLMDGSDKKLNGFVL